MNLISHSWSKPSKNELMSPSSIHSTFLVQGKPETLNFLDFTHICARKRSNGMFTVLRRTVSKRIRAKLKEVRKELRKRTHHRVAEVGKWLRSVVAGHNRYFGVPANQRSLASFAFRWCATGTGRCGVAAKRAD